MSFYLAPMEGVIDFYFRDLLTSINPIKAGFTEFLRINNHLLSKKDFYTIYPELKNKGRTSNNTPIYLQLLGSNINAMAENAAFAVQLGALGIDLNFGCPSKKVNQNHAGAYLLSFPEKIFKISQAVRQAVPYPLPVSAKIRTGLNDKTFYKDVLLALEAAKLSWITIHARTRKQNYSPPLDFEALLTAQETIGLPIIGNGDIFTPRDYHHFVKKTQLTNVSIGRGLLMNPFLIKQIDFVLKEENASSLSPPWSSVFKQFLLLIQQYSENQSEAFTLARSKQWLGFLKNQYSDAQILFNQIKTIDNTNELLETLSINTKETNGTSR